MTRQIKEFSSLEDFNAPSTSKLALASLCVTLKSVVLEFEKTDLAVRTVLSSKETDLSKVKKSIEKCIDERNSNLEKILLNVMAERNKNQSDKLPNMSKASDIFNNITENFPVQTDNETKEWEKEFFLVKSSLEKKEKEIRQWSEETGKNIVLIKLLEEENRQLKSQLIVVVAIVQS
jgi:hypothetical protein